MHAEALSRTLAGIAPWIELGGDDTPEGRLRGNYGEMARAALGNATDPKSPDYLNPAHFATVSAQALVEAAYIALALLRAPGVLWEPLTESQKRNVAAALRGSRIVTPLENNWVLYPSTVEAALWRFTGDVRRDRLKYGIEKHKLWYCGDGTYGDGPEFSWGYYNSYAVHPMLLDVLNLCREKSHPAGPLFHEELRRAQRYATVLERLISPEGTFPVVGRSGSYRFGAFQALAQIILWKQTPRSINLGAARAGMTAVVRRMVEAPGTFDKDGWLQVGAVGHQPGIRDAYTSTGSLYMCLNGLLHLGLPPADPFWQAPAADWTQRKIWSGEDVPADAAYVFQRTYSLFRRVLYRFRLLGRSLFRRSRRR